MEVMTADEIALVNGGHDCHPHTGLTSFAAISVKSLPDWFKEKPKPVDLTGTYQIFIDPDGSPEAEAIRRGQGL